MSPKECSLAYDETVKEFEADIDAFEPELKVIVNARYKNAPVAFAASHDVVEVMGRITVSF